MNAGQTIVAWMGATVIVLVVLFPPWHQHSSYSRGDILFSPPDRYSLNYGHLALEVGLIGGVTGGVLFAAKTRKPRKGVHDE